MTGNPLQQLTAYLYSGYRLDSAGLELMTGIPLQQLTADSLPVLRVKAELYRSRADDREPITAANS